MRYFLVFATVCLAVVLAGWTWLQPPPAPQARQLAAFGVNGRRYEWVQFGMTEKQVEAIMGGPSGMYDGQPHQEPLSMAPIIGFGFGDGTHSSLWHFGNCAIEVWFDKAGTVDMKELETEDGATLECAKRPPTLADRLDSAWKWVCRLAAPHP